LCLVALFVAAACAALPVNPNCTLHTVSGKYFDLNPLTRTDKGYSFQTSGETVYVNLCANTVGECGTPACVDDGWIYSLGSLANFNISQDPISSNILVTYIKGDYCYPTGSYKTILDISCSRNSSEITHITNVDTSSSCTYKISMVSPYACPIGGGGAMDGGWIFIIIVLCLAVVYIIGGIIVMHKVYHQPLADSFPHAEFWKAIPGLVLDGLKFTYAKISGLFGHHTSQGEFQKL